MAKKKRKKQWQYNNDVCSITSTRSNGSDGGLARIKRKRTGRTGRAVEQSRKNGK